MGDLLARVNSSSCDEIKCPGLVEYMLTIWVTGMIYQTCGTFQYDMNSMDGERVFPAVLDNFLNNALHDHIAFLEVAESKNTFP
jgi:hypothetical protein